MSIPILYVCFLQSKAVGLEVYITKIQFCYLLAVTLEKSFNLLEPQLPHAVNKKYAEGYSL